jgi:hypothetical protein
VRRPWTPEEIRALRRWLGLKRAISPARELGRTEAAVRAKSHARGWSLRMWRE